ncbi:MAG: sulfur carrier protein ThiS [Firmicutes bacterium]|nr:sulfur carrier protein ThiS [Bacillota bacterium]
MILNGKKITVEKGISLAEFLLKQGYDLTRVAVERNGEIVPKKQFDMVMLEDSDKIEVVHFVGGG